MKISQETLNRLINNSINAKQNKYHNKKVIVDNIKFDSKKEMNRYNQLKLLEKAGLISELELQKKFELQPKYVNNKNEHIRAIIYIADFFYYDNKKQKYIVEDVKSEATKKDKVYNIKKKMFMYQYVNIDFKEVI